MMEPTTLQEIPETPVAPAVPLPPLDPVGHGGPPAARGDGFSGKPGDFAKDMAILAGKGVVPPAVPETPVPAQPVQPQAAVTPPATEAVPEKFQNPDGTPNAEKVEKSLINVDKALETYRQKEKELRQLQNNVHRMTVAPPAPATPAPAAPQPEAPQDLEALINADLAANPQNAGRVLAKWAGAIQASAVQQALGGVESLKEQVEAQELRREMESMGKADPWLLTEEGPRELFRIRQENPHLNQAKRPWREAYKTYLGEQEMKQRLGSQVTMPTPKGTTAPVAPAVPTNRAPSSPQLTPGKVSKDEINAHLAGKSYAEQDAFFRSRGLPGLPKGGK